VEQKDASGCVLTTHVPSIREIIVVKDNHVLGVVQMFKSSNDFDFHVNLDKQTQSHS
jgi:hypothetical protein